MRASVVGTWILAVAFAAGLVGCAAKPPPMPPLPPPPPPPVPLHLAVHVAADANPDIAGRASPVVIRVYLLRSNDAFKGQDLEPLYFRDKEVLAADLVSREEWTLRPGETHEATWMVPPEVHAVGLMAALREYRGLPWKIEIPIPAPPSPKAAPDASVPFAVEVDRTGVHAHDVPKPAGR